MARFAASEAIFSVDLPGGALTAFHDGATSVTWNLARDNSTHGTLGTNHIKKAYSGKAAVTGQIVCQKDTTPASLYQTLEQYMTDATYRDTPFSMRVEAPDGATGSDRYDMEIILTAQDESADADSGDAATATFSFNVDATYAKTVIT